MNVVDAEMFRAMLRSGALDLQRHSEEVNRLNVFPVPDGDTGVNMLATLRGGVDAVNASSSNSLGEVCKAMSHGMLLSARGNSGVILSQFFAGLSDGLSAYDQCNVTQFAQAFEKGVKRAYEVVVKPVEGTILTVLRVGCEEAMKIIDSTTSFEDYFATLIGFMRETLRQTPDLLPVLKEAGVIDSGGAGLIYIIEGMGQALGGRIIEEVSFGFEHTHGHEVEMPLSGFDENSTLDFGYCTEFILQLTRDKDGVAKFKLQDAIEYLETIGDSLVAFQDGTLVKVHVHTKTPDRAISYALQFGEFVRFKMENMTLQHNQTLVEKSKDVSLIAKPEAKKKPLAAVAVVPTKEAGDIFKNYNVDETICVGPFMNPGADDFLKAFERCHAESIIVLPNNKNEILVAEMAASMCKSAKVHVIHTANIAEGLSCASVFDFADLDLDDNLARSQGALRQSLTFALFPAMRTTSLYGVPVKEGQFVYVENEKEVHTGNRPDEVLVSWLKKQGEGHSLLTLLVSSSLSEEAIQNIIDEASEIDDFMEVQTLSIGDCPYTMYAVLD